MLNRLFYPFSPLILFSLAQSAVFAIYLVGGMSPSPESEIVASFCWALLLAMWILADARRHDRVPCFDFGFLCYAFLPFSVMWYCVWSRGWAGLMTLTAICTTLLAPYVVANLVWLALYG